MGASSANTFCVRGVVSARPRQASKRPLAGRVFYQSPATWFSDTTLQEQWRTFDFPSRMLRRNPPQDDFFSSGLADVALRLGPVIGIEQIKNELKRVD